MNIQQQHARNRALVRTLLTAMIALSLWVFGHFYLTYRHDTTPWKLGGMAMYVKAGPHYTMTWNQRFGGLDYEMNISENDIEELFARQTSERFILSFGNLIGLNAPAAYLMSTRASSHPIVATVTREKYSALRSRYIDRSCRYELVYLEGEMFQNRVCRSLNEAVVRLQD